MQRRRRTCSLLVSGATAHARRATTGSTASQEAQARQERGLGCALLRSFLALPAGPFRAFSADCADCADQPHKEANSQTRTRHTDESTKVTSAE